MVFNGGGGCTSVSLLGQSGEPPTLSVLELITKHLKHPTVLLYKDPTQLPCPSRNVSSFSSDFLCVLIQHATLEPLSHF